MHGPGADLSEPATFREGPLPTIADLVSRLRRPLKLLLEANAFAEDAGQDCWQFSVELIELQLFGLTTSAVRWLVHKGYVKHAVETTKAFGQPGRTFRQTTNLTVSGRSCLVLTAAGIEFARQISTPASIVAAGQSAQIATELPPDATPHWNPESRVLRVGHIVVKHFRVPAGNQELILSAFQEEGWPDRIYDPLPPAAEIDAKRRLHDTINRLNRNQKQKLICFTGDGNGRGVCWKMHDENGLRAT